MSGHKKLAIIIAPLLIVIGYIASDYYLEYKAEEHKVFQLAPEDVCDILNDKCILKAGEFKVNIFDKEGMTTVNSTFPLDEVTLFLVNKQDKATPYPLSKIKTAYYWHKKTPLRENFEKSSDQQKLRIIARVKGSQFIGEFYTRNTNYP